MVFGCEEAQGLVPGSERARDCIPSRSRGESDEDEESMAVVAAGEAHRYGDLLPSWRHGVLGSILVISALFLMVVFTSRQSAFLLPATHSSKTVPMRHSSSVSPTARDENMLGLLEGRALQEAVGNAAVRLGEITATLHQQTNANRSAEMAMETSSLAKLVPSETRRLKAEAQSKLKEVLHNFFKIHNQAASFLTSIYVSAEHAADILSVLTAVTDPRILSVGMKASRECADHGMKQNHLAKCLQEQAAAHGPNLRQLRDELLPVALRKEAGTSTKKNHLEVLRHGFFRASKDVEGWHADLEVSPRRLKSFGSSPVAMVTPINWFTIGAPVVSNMLGLVFLSLMALLPGTGGLPTNRPANYALWGIQGATTLGECLANIGFPRGIVYFASCIIDVMFVGLEVIWVFIDGQQVSGPRMTQQCFSYSQWPRLQGACGNCMALVPGAQFGNRCDVFCESFGHSAEFAARAVPGSCFPQGRYGVREQIPFDVILCQCILSVRQLAAVPVFTLDLPTLDDKWRQEKHSHDSHLEFVSQEGRRLQSSPQCSHSEPYVFQIFVSTQRQANGVSPSFGLVIAGQLVRGFRFLVDQADLGQMLQTRPLFLPQRPERLILEGLTIFGYRRIAMVRGAETTTILDSENGLPAGNNRFWVRNSDINSRFAFALDFNSLVIPVVQEFRISREGNLSSVTSMTMTTTGLLQPGMLTLEVVTSGQRRQTSPSLTSTFEVNAVFNNLNNTGRQQFLVIERRARTDFFDCRSVSISFARRPQNFTLQASGTLGQYSYSSIYVVDQGGSAPVITSINAVAIGRNSFWVGTVDRNIRRSNFFVIPNVTSTTVTETTTSRQQCMHDVPYIIQIFTSTQPEADTTSLPQVWLSVGGNMSGPIFLQPQIARLGQTVQTVPLFISDRPTRLMLIGVGGPYGYSRIAMVRGAEATTILDSRDDVPIGNNSFWIRGNLTTNINSSVRMSQEFTIPSVGSLASNTSSTTGAPFTNSDIFTLEVVTSGQARAALTPGSDPNRGFNSMVVDLVIEVPGAGGQQAGAQLLPTTIRPGFFECISISFNFSQRPMSLTLEASGSSDVWGYSSVRFTDSSGTVAVVDTDASGISTVVESPFGVPLGNNPFWIGALSGSSGQVRQRQMFTIPAFTTSTTTTTSTTATATTLTGSTSSITMTTFTGSTTSSTTKTTATSSGAPTGPTSTTMTGSVAPPRLQCPPYSAWQNLTGLPCGNCEALVAAVPSNGICANYCSSIGLECVAAWDDVDGTCSRRNQVDCIAQVPNAGLSMLCTCQTIAASPVAEQCTSYSRWPQIDVNVCGGCTAAVALRVPSRISRDSCSDFCKSFNHQCTAASVQGTSPCSQGRPLNCSDHVESALCTCIQ